MTNKENKENKVGGVFHQKPTGVEMLLENMNR